MRRSLALAVATLAWGARLAAADEPPAAEPPAADATTETIEILQTAPSVADVQRRSAEAITVVETREARRESAPLGEVMARTQGVAVRSQGGLGSYARVSLNGLYDDQIRVFLDGVPLELAGHGFGLANVPVNLVDRVEIFRGVVPVRFGADALGGAINLVTERPREGAHAALSYQQGSYGNFRLTASASQRGEDGFYAGARGFFDLADNDYPVLVQVTDALGRQSPATLDLFHDRYRAAGGRLELGVVGQPWARTLALAGYFAVHDKDIPSNVIMTVPYGEARYGDVTGGATLRYQQPLLGPVTLGLTATYAEDRVDFVDDSDWVYDWYGRQVRERPEPGELEERAYDQLTTRRTALALVQLTAPLGDAQALTFLLAPRVTWQSGEDHLNPPGTLDPLALDRRLATLVGGVEHTLRSLDERLENVGFAKAYVYRARGEEIVGDDTVTRDLDVDRFGVGDALRYRVTDWLWAKASYEFATRLPDAGEVFGSGALVASNLALQPERSHNLNLSATVDLRGLPGGDVRAEVNGFLRDLHDYIILFPMQNFFRYVNVSDARSLGVEGSAGWTAPGGWLALDANATYLDLRNSSSEGTFRMFEGDRLPNKPYLFANGAARLRFTGVSLADDELSLGVYTRYVHDFYRSWGSVGLPDSKQSIPTQLAHTVGVTYTVRGRQTVTTGVECENLTDARLYDAFGLQKPGRTFTFKITAEL